MNWADSSDPIRKAIGDVYYDNAVEIGFEIRCFWEQGYQTYGGLLFYFENDWLTPSGWREGAVLSARHAAAAITSGITLHGITGAR